MRFELTIGAPADLVEAVSDVLLEEQAAVAVWIEDAEAGTEREHPVFGEPGPGFGDAPSWSRATIKALFADSASATSAALRTVADPRCQGASVQTIDPIDERDWVRRSQSEFTSTRITDDFWVVPSWRQPPPGATRIIRLDPGLAFGTGTHPTTRMCLRHIADRARTRAAPWRRVLDYGCGSGILAIGAALFGAVEVEAVDIDPAAIESTRANVLANRVVVKVGLPDLAQGRYAMVLANILATPLRLLAPLLCARLDDDAELVLAGILERQADELTTAYAPWVALRISDLDEGWVLMTGKPGRTGSHGMIQR